MRNIPRLASSAPLARRWPGPAAWLAVLAVALAAYHYFTGENTALPVQLVPHLTPLTLVLDSVAVGPARLPLPVYGYVVSLTHDVGGPYTRPEAATAWLLMLALGLAGWLAVASLLQRTAFVVATVPLVLLLTSLNADGLGIFGNSGQQTFLILALLVLGAAALALQLWGERVQLAWRVLLFGALVVGLAGLLVARTTLPLPETALYLAANATPAGAVLVAALALWVGIENVRALLWFNTQAERPEGRFGLLPLVLSSGLYVGALALYYFNGRELSLGWGLHLDPLVLLLLAVLVGWLGLQQRVAALPGGWLPLSAARPLYELLVVLAAGALGYALATANSPLLDAARDFVVLALGLLGAAFLLYALVNFGPLIRQRLPVHRVAFEPRRLPLYAVYVLALGTIVVLQVRSAWPLLDQVAAGTSNQLGDLARQQSETFPDELATALLAESYYARSGDELDRFNRSAQLGRAALYRFREQTQNEQNALRRALLRQPDDRVSLRLAAQLTEPADFLAALDVLREAHRADPRSFALTSDLAQLFTRSNLTDSVLFYLNQSARLAPHAYVGRTNELALALGQQQYAAARPLTASPAGPTEPALAANQELLQLLAPVRYAPTLPDAVPAARDLHPADFTQLYHQTLLTVRMADQAALLRLLPVLTALTARPANGTYYEQLLFLQALSRHAAGQELAARQVLAPLTAGNGASAGYYQYVLGLWQLQQQQYGTAAAQLALAASHRAAAAPLALAWAQAYAGRPDSARAQALRLVGSADATMHHSAGRLMSVLAAGTLRALAPAVSPAGAVLAARAAKAKKPAQAARLYEQALAEAPFNEAVVLAVSAFYTAQQQPGNAYEALRRGLVENPDSAPLLQAYALAAASDGLAELGQSALEQLRSRLSATAYAALVAQFRARQAAYMAAATEFGR